MHVYPNIVTICNLLCGLGSIFASFIDKPFLAAYLIFFGMVLDFFDGKIARRINIVSNVGTYLDSLADFISFGIAPVVFVYEIFPLGYKRVVFYCVLIYLVCGFIRLIRYTFYQKSQKKGIFLGLPIPAAAGSVVSFILIAIETNIKFPVIAVIAMVIITAFLMISTRPYRHFGIVISSIPLFMKIFIIVLGMLALFNYCFDLWLLVGFMLYIIVGGEWQEEQAITQEV